MIEYGIPKLFALEVDNKFNVDMEVVIYSGYLYMLSSITLNFKTKSMRDMDVFDYKIQTHEDIEIFWGHEISGFIWG